MKVTTVLMDVQWKKPLHKEIHPTTSATSNSNAAYYKNDTNANLRTDVEGTSGIDGTLTIQSTDGNEGNGNMIIAVDVPDLLHSRNY